MPAGSDIYPWEWLVVGHHVSLAMIGLGNCAVWIHSSSYLPKTKTLTLIENYATLIHSSLHTGATIADIHGFENVPGYSLSRSGFFAYLFSVFFFFLFFFIFFLFFFVCLRLCVCVCVCVCVFCFILCDFTHFTKTKQKKFNKN